VDDTRKPSGRAGAGEKTTMKVESLLARLGGVRPIGTGWQALCPAHPDSNPSFSINVCDSKILIHCHAGCSQEAVLKAIGIDARELFLDATNSERLIVETYNYVDEQSNLLYQVVRYEPKDFRQRRPNRNGGWVWNVKGVRRVLYHLPEVLKAESVLLVEGEKDADTASMLGRTATSSGAVGQWREECTDCLRGKQITIIADADDPGRKHAQVVAASLRDKTASLKLLELPDAKDLSEWVEQGGTPESLSKLILDAPQWQPIPQGQTNKNFPRGGFNLTSLRDLLQEPTEHISWLLSDKLPAGGLSILCAKPKVGKSTFARCLSLAVSRGEPFLGCPTTKGPVIYLALEEKRSEVRRHFEDLGATDEEIYIYAASAPQEAFLGLWELVKQIHPVLIVIDPLFKFVRIRDEKAYAEVCNAIEPLLTLARETGAHVLLLHHSGKMERSDAMDSILGSTAIFGAVDSAIVLKKTDRYRTVQSSQRYGTDWPELVLNFEAAERSLSLGIERSEAEAGRISEAIVAYLSGCDEPQTRVQIEAHVEGKTKHKRTALKTLSAAGRVSESGAGTKGDPLRYELSQKAKNQAREGSEQIVDSCSQVYTETREQQSEKKLEPNVNTNEILVPVVSRERQDDADSGDQAFLEGKL
jgi:hypothetical protein